MFGSLLASIRASNAAVPHSTSNPPVAIFVGGTSGIGKGMVQTFARHTNGNSHILVVGRNREAAEQLFATIPTGGTPPGSTGKFTREFIQCDVTLMKNIHTATQDILSRHPKVNYLVMTTGIMTLKGRDETSEGIDKKLAVHYYSRWKFINDLLPSLTKAKDAGEEGAVLSIFSAGYGGPIDLDDLGLKKNYSTSNAASSAPTYNDLMLEVCTPTYILIIF